MENELLLETFTYGIKYGISLFFVFGILSSTFELIYETAFEKQWKRNSFIKYLDEDDIRLINYYLSDTYLTSIHCQETAIGRVIVNAYNKDIELKKLRKQRRKEFFDKLKFWKRKDNEK